MPAPGRAGPLHAGLDLLDEGLSFKSHLQRVASWTDVQVCYKTWWMMCEGSRYKDFRMELLNCFDLLFWEKSFENLANVTSLLFKTALSREIIAVLSLWGTVYPPVINSWFTLVVSMGEEVLVKALIITSHQCSQKDLYCGPCSSPRSSVWAAKISSN